MEHGAVPDDLDERAPAAGLYQRGALCPFGKVKQSKFRHQRIPQNTDPGFAEIAALKKRLASESDPAS